MNLLDDKTPPYGFRRIMDREGESALKPEMWVAWQGKRSVLGLDSQ
jgi:hypothetical protein